MKTKKKKVFILLAALFFTCAAVFAWLVLKPLPYEALINDNAGKCLLDAALVKAVIKAESDFNPNALSSRGARGLMQIMPLTAREIARRSGFTPYNDEMLFEPSVNIMFGCIYMRALLDLFGQNLFLALAAYNAGMGNVEIWQKRNGGAQLEIENIPFAETREYIRKTERIYKFYKGAEKLKRLITKK